MNVNKKILFAALMVGLMFGCKAHAQHLVNRFEVYSVGIDGEYSTNNIVINNPAILGPLPFGRRPAELMIEAANDIYAIGMFSSGGHMFFPGRYENLSHWNDIYASGPRMSLTFRGRGYSTLLDDSWFEVLNISYDNQTSMPTSFDIIAYQHCAAEWGMPGGHMFLRFTWNILEEQIGESLAFRAQAALVPEPSAAAISFAALLFINRSRRK